MHWPLRFAQLPISVVEAGHSPRPHQPFQLITLQFGDLSDRLFERDLDLRQRRHRHPNGQIIIKDLIFAQISMRQNKVAQKLAVSQSRAMPHHNPSMRSQDCNVIGRGLGIRWTNPDIHQCDPRAVRALEMISWHLRLLGRSLQGSIGVGNLCVARTDKARIAAGLIGQHSAAIGFKLAHIKLVVCEENMVLEVLWRCRRIMRQTRQRIIDALRRKRRKWSRHPVGRLVSSIYDVVVCRT